VSEPRHAEPVSRAEAIVSLESARLGALLLLDRLKIQCAEELACDGDHRAPEACELTRDIAKYLTALAGPQ
jgi:hypothetical protein